MKFTIVKLDRADNEITVSYIWQDPWDLDRITEHAGEITVPFFTARNEIIAKIRESIKSELTDGFLEMVYSGIQRNLEGTEHSIYPSKGE